MERRVLHVAIGEHEAPPLGATKLGVRDVRATVYERPSDGGLFIAVHQKQTDPESAADASSNTAGKLWRPKAGESRSDFFERAKANDPDFDASIWIRNHLVNLRKEMPDNFTGQGW